jgi:hypothetical protein
MACPLLLLACPFLLLKKKTLCQMKLYPTQLLLQSEQQGK